MPHRLSHPRLLGAILLTTATVMGTPVQSATLTLLTETGFGQGLVNVNSMAPGSPLGAMQFISGLQRNERLLGIDYRPLTGQLYGLSDHHAIYTIDPTSGVASRVGGGFADQLDGVSFGFDFNPVIDKIRVVSDADQNYVADPISGDANIAATTPVFYTAGDVNEGNNPNVLHHAYNGNVANSSSTLLHAIDSRLNVLVTQANNAGTLTTIGELGVNATDIGGFDISAMDVGWAVFGDLGLGSSRLYQIDLVSGAATSFGSIGELVSGLAVSPDLTPVPLPAALPMFLAGLAGLGLLRRRRPA